MIKLNSITCTLSIAFLLFIIIGCTVETDPKTTAATSTALYKDTKEPSTPTFQNGDIIFQTSKSSQSKAIQLATNSPYSHVGIVYEQKGSFWVYEAIEPVKLTPLKAWIKRGEDEQYVVKRLKNAATTLSPKVLKKMKAVGEKYLGKHYDLYFEWSDDKIYCSELVWKIYKEATGIELGKLETLESFDLSNDVVQRKLQERYKGNIPLDEKVISPAAVFESSQLTTVQNL